MNQHDLVKQVVIQFKKTVDQGEPDEGLWEKLIDQIDGRYGDVVDRQLRERNFAQAVEEYDAFLEFGRILNTYKDLIKKNGPKFTANILFNQGAAYEGLGKLDLAIETYRNALELEDMTDKMMGAINYNLGTVLAGRNNFRQAQEHLLAAQETGFNPPGFNPHPWILDSTPPQQKVFWLFLSDGQT